MEGHILPHSCLWNQDVKKLAENWQKRLNLQWSVNFDFGNKLGFALGLRKSFTELAQKRNLVPVIINMNAEIAKAWIADLRSGKFKQGKGSLQPTPDTFCCLGVLCKIAERFGLKEVPTIGHYLPEKVRIWADMRSDTGDLPKTLSLANMNDQGSSFLETADIIEKHYDLL